MHSIADMGGIQGFGPILRDKDEPIFKAEWEATTFGVNILALAGGCFNIDESRSVMERIPPLEYLATSYYEHWLLSLEDLLISKGIFEKHEYEDRIRELAAKGI
jgi:nitrile hydratase